MPEAPFRALGLSQLKAFDLGESVRGRRSGVFGGKPGFHFNGICVEHLSALQRFDDETVADNPLFGHQRYSMLNRDYHRSMHPGVGG